MRNDVAAQMDAALARSQKESDEAGCYQTGFDAGELTPHSMILLVGPPGLEPGTNGL
jgi:hypothetical protein